MKKLLTFFAAVLLSASLAFSQPVSDMGVIPIGVTLNSILRLNIISGGNIEFVVSSIAQYTGGIANSALYDTHFTVSSSVDFDVLMYAETATLDGSDDPGHHMPLDNVGYSITSNGTGVDLTDWTIPANITGAGAHTALTNAAANTIVQNIVNHSAGDATKNDFTINWELGTMLGTMNAQSLLAQSLSSDRYSTNVFLILKGYGL